MNINDIAFYIILVEGIAAVAYVFLGDLISFKTKIARSRCTCGHLFILHVENKNGHCTDNTCGYSCTQYEAM